MDDIQKRSSDQPAAALHAPAQGVGGRQPSPPTPLQGGGYQDIRTILNFCAGDMRIEDLKKMGLPARHLQLAEAMGIDAYLAMWRFVGSSVDFLNRCGYVELKMRPYKSFLRYQRNRLIQSLAGAGLLRSEIRRILKSDLGENLSTRHISRVIRRG